MKKLKKYKISVKLNHPNGKFYIQEHVIERAEKVFELNEKEVKELHSDGCKKWLTFSEVKE